jgi:hypothetical protein
MVDPVVAVREVDRLVQIADFRTQPALGIGLPTEADEEAVLIEPRVGAPVRVNGYAAGPLPANSVAIIPIRYAIGQIQLLDVAPLK